MRVWFCNITSHDKCGSESWCDVESWSLHTTKFGFDLQVLHHLQDFPCTVIQHERHLFYFCFDPTDTRIDTQKGPRSTQNLKENIPALQCEKCVVYDIISLLYGKGSIIVTSYTLYTCIHDVKWGQYLYSITLLSVFPLKHQFSLPPEGVTLCRLIQWNCDEMVIVIVGKL